MTKSRISRVFVGGVLAMVGGGILTFIALMVSGMNGGFVMRGPDVVGINGTSLGWSMSALVVLGIVTIAGGAIAQFVAWIGAVINTSQLQDKTWFVVLLVLGVFSFGFFGMVWYVVAGPDGSEALPRHGLAASPSRPA